MKPQICLVPKLKGLGGTASFQMKFVQGLAARKIPWTFDLNHPANTAVLVIAGTRHLWQLQQTKRRGVKIVQRLDGINWIHRVDRTPIKGFLRAEINNRILATIRRRTADEIVYQSQFSQDWWNRVFGKIPMPSNMVYNGVDLEQYAPHSSQNPPDTHFRILLVEGHLSGAYTRGLEAAVRLAGAVEDKLSCTVELMVVGDVSDAAKARAHTLAPQLWITWKGILPRESIPEVDRAAHVLFSADLNAACPNSVIEAMACGCPIIAFDTGSLSELVQAGAGAVVPYGANYWQLEEPRISPLADACIHILENNAMYRKHARRRAEVAFGLDDMVESYLKALVK